VVSVTDPYGRIFGFLDQKKMKFSSNKSIMRSIKISSFLVGFTFLTLVAKKKKSLVVYNIVKFIKSQLTFRKKRLLYHLLYQKCQKMWQKLMTRLCWFLYSWNLKIEATCPTETLYLNGPQGVISQITTNFFKKRLPCCILQRTFR
jgi:hypothetical protein